MIGLFEFSKFIGVYVCFGSNCCVGGVVWGEYYMDVDWVVDGVVDNLFCGCWLVCVVVSIYVVINFDFVIGFVCWLDLGYVVCGELFYRCSW